MKSITKCLTACVIAVVCVFTAEAAGKQWNNWRGPYYNGSSDEKNLPSSWSETENIRWKTKLPGNGASSPIVSDGNIFLSAEVGESKDLTAICVDRVSGEIRWQQILSKGSRIPRNTMASPSPVVDGRAVYFMFGNCVLTAMDFDGKIKWTRDFEKDYGANNIKFGYSSTPLLYEGKLYVTAIRPDKKMLWPKKEGKIARNAYLLALNPEDGKTIWRHVRPTNADDESQDAYSSPVPCEASGRKEIIILGGDCVTGHNPETGDELWRWSGYNEKNSDRNRLIASPLVAGEMVIVCAPRHRGVYALRIGENGEVGERDFLWKASGGADTVTPLYYDGILYVVDGDRKRLYAIDPGTGGTLWNEQLPSKKVYRASPTGADGKIYCLGGDGKVTVFKAGRECKVLATMEMGGDFCRSSIAVSDGCLFVRTTETLYCIGK